MRNILCPTDFSRSAERALEHALEFALAFNAKITLLHVYQPAAIKSAPLTAPRNERANTDATKYEAALRTIIEQLGDLPVEFDCVTCAGPAWERIVSRADALNADLIVIGRNGRAGSSQMFVGSTATRVVKHARVPVLTVRA